MEAQKNFLRYHANDEEMKKIKNTKKMKHGSLMKDDIWLPKKNGQAFVFNTGGLYSEKTLIPCYEIV
jgi:hypothetical protein